MKRKNSKQDLIESFSHMLTLLETPLATVRMAVANDDGSRGDNELQTLLTAEEIAQADTRQDAAERRHMLFRRAFQRLFVARLIGWTQDPATLPMRHATDRAPSCDAAPDHTLSFSSSRNCFVAAAAAHAMLGIDIEERRVVENAGAIAERFFTAEEATLVKQSPDDRRSETFQEMWCAKEAGLKAKSRGIDTGLNTFTLHRVGSAWKVSDSESPESGIWQLWFCPGLPRHIVALMHRSHTKSRVR